MKRLVQIFIMNAIIMTFSYQDVLAVPPDFCGGVNNEYEYREEVFVTGTPVEFVGTLKTADTTSGNTRTIKYNFSLVSKDNVKDKLTRNWTYQINYDQHNTQGQTIAKMIKSSGNETITIGSDKYILKNKEDYQLSKSDIIDNRPAADFYSGTLSARKVYTINTNQGQVIIDIDGGDVGYKNFWGNTETQQINYHISTKRTFPASSGQTTATSTSWEGTVRISVSDSATKTLQYSENEPTYTSFSGGEVRVTNGEMVSQYDYDLPTMTNNIADDQTRVKGSVKLSEQMLPQIERLIIPKFRDIGGHWAEEDIKELYSLDVFDGSTQFFAPDIPMTRMDFAKAVIKACDIRVTSTAKKPAVNKKAPAETSPFKDLSVDDPDYIYAKTALQKGIIRGNGQDFLLPDNPLTRAEAITVLVKALGFDSQAPAPGYSTTFADDKQIPAWSRDSIYAAQGMGLINGDTANKANPNQQMTRAESSNMLVRFLKFLENDLQKDYRDNIILFS